MDEQCEKFKRELEDINKYQRELKNTITKIKYIKELINSRLDTEEQIIILENNLLGGPKIAFGFLSKNKRHIFHFHQELY